MSRSTPFLIGKGVRGGVARTPRDAGGAARSSPSPNAPSAAEQAVVTVVFRKSRREGFSMDIDTSEELAKCPDATRIPFRRIAAGITLEKNRDSESRPQRNLFRSIFGSQVSRDFRVSSQVTWCPV